MIDYVAYILVKGINKLFSIIPVEATLWLGRRIGTIAFLCNRRRRLVAYANLKAAFCREKAPAELKAITHRVYQTLVQTFVEIMNLTKVNRAYVDRYVEVVNMDRIRNAAASGRGTILLTAHFGDWELSSLVSSVEGYPILVLAREQKMKRLNELLNQLRESNGCTVVRKGMSTKNILKALYGKRIVGILSDQDAGRKGLFIDFFGRPTSCHAGPFEIAKHTGSLILPNFIVRTKGAHHRLHLEAYIDPQETVGDDDIRAYAQRFFSVLESYIRKYPDQWLWLHKRWKSTPVRTVLVLNDGKAGHLNQSLAIAEEIRAARVTQGYAPGDTTIVVIDVRYRSPAHRAALMLAAGVSSWRCHGCMRCVKACLAPETYEKLMRTYAEFVVSCGSSLAPVNVFMARENNARNIVVMKPHLPGSYRKFDLAIVPAHDNPPRRDNIVATVLAPNRATAERIAADAASLGARLAVRHDRYLGVFIGGDTPEFILTQETLDTVIGKALDFAATSGRGLLVTTSRRTPAWAAARLKERLSGNARCALLVIANEENPPETVAGILGLSDIVMISEESISMISEAVSACRRTVVFKLARKGDAVVKHQRSVARLVADGRVSLAAPADLGNALAAIDETAAPGPYTVDRERIFAGVRRLI